MHGETQGHDVRVVLGEPEGRRILGERGYVHLEEIHHEFAIDVVKLIVILAVGFFKILPADFFKIMQVVRTLGIDAFVYHEVQAVLFVIKTVRTVRAFKGTNFFESVVIRTECSLAYLAQKLALLAVVFVKKRLRSLAGRARAVIGDVAPGTAANGFDGLTVPLFIVVVEILPVPILVMVNNFGKLINLKLLIFGRMGIIKGPLF